MNKQDLNNIINEVLYDDVSSVIINFLYGKCYYCKKEFNVNDLGEGLNKKHYCKKCISCYDIKYCSKCNLHFEKYLEGIFCGICLSLCSVFCYKCFEKRKEPEILSYIDTEHFNFYWIVQQLRRNSLSDISD